MGFLDQFVQNLRKYF